MTDPAFPSEFVETSRLILQNDSTHKEAEALLDSWFREGLTRSSSPTISVSQKEAALAQWCAQVYKRGLRAIDLKTPAGDESSVLGRQDPAAVSDLIPSFRETSSESLLESVVADRDRGFFCVLDGGFLKHWKKWQLEHKDHPKVVVHTPREKTKTLDTIRAWAQKMPPNTSGVWSIGGGITTDMAGFLAGLLHLPHRSSPTTFLSASDASLGGKTGVNHPLFGKNQLGLFYPTEDWVVAAEHFQSLNHVEICCGLAETLKHVWLWGEEGDTSTHIEQLLRPQSPRPESALKALVQFNYKVKRAFVEADPFEKGLRKALNLGHTVGHLLEGLGESGWIPPLPHGLAVAAGLRFLMRSDLGWVSTWPEGFEKAVERLCQEISPPLPQKCPGHIDTENWETAFWRLLRNDKKQEDPRAAAEMQISFATPSFGHFSSLAVNSSSSSLSVPQQKISFSHLLQLLKKTDTLVV